MKIRSIDHIVLTTEDLEKCLEELKTFSPVFEEDIYDAISMETCVNKRLTIGAPGEEAMKQVIAAEEAYLADNWRDGIQA